MKRIIAILIFFSPFVWRMMPFGLAGGGGEVLAQQKIIQYDKNFIFKEGVYFSFNDFKNNSPVPASRIISDYNKNSQDFFNKVFSKRTFSYVDNEGKEQTEKTNDIWGYCSNGTVYINYGADFNRMTIIGNISHFLATVKVRMANPDPFYYDRTFGMPQQYMYVTSQCILDFETGNIFEFNVDNMELLLSRDEELNKSFLALKRRQKRDAIFLYLRKYNEKHPIYFPE